VAAFIQLNQVDEGTVDPEEKLLRQKLLRKDPGREESVEGKISSHILTKKKKKQLPLKNGN